MRSEAMEFFTSSLNKILSKYDNIFLVGDLSVDKLDFVQILQKIICLI